MVSGPRVIAFLWKMRGVSSWKPRGRTGVYVLSKIASAHISGPTGS